MSEHANSCKRTQNTPIIHYNSVTARPLLTVSQDKFWKGLVNSYIKYFHPKCMLFSLANFNINTASKSLLSAIHFAGYIVQPNPQEEVLSYMNTYAKCNIRKIMFTMKLSSVQALGIYSYAFFLNGDSTQSRTCLFHFYRMAHGLGININQKNMPLFDKYNRITIYNNISRFFHWEKLGPSSDNLLNEDETELDIYDPKFHTLSSELNLCNNTIKYNVYSIFLSKFSKLTNLNSRINSIFYSCDFKSIEEQIGELYDKTNEVYGSAKSTLESIMVLAPELNDEISAYLELIKSPYIANELCIYTKMTETSKNTKSAIIDTVISKCVELWDMYSRNKILISIWSFGPYIAAFHLIKIHSKSTKNQKKTILYILKTMVNFYFNEGNYLNSLNFLILNSLFKSLNSSECCP
jgi:hypothetical protein